jgi:hypothetical protein
VIRITVTIAEETGAVNMSDSDKKQDAAALIVPSKVILQHEDPASQEAYNAEQKQLRQARAVMLLDKVEQENIIKDAKPRLEDATAEVARLNEKINKAGAKAVSKLKLSEEFADVKKALRAIKINSLECSIAFGGVEYTGKGRILFSRTVGRKARRDYGSTAVMVGDDSMPLTEELQGLVAQLKEAEELRTQLLEAIMDAQTKLRDRANRMSDVEGAIALKNLDEAEAEEVKSVYANLQGGMSAAALLGSGE